MDTKEGVLYRRPWFHGAGTKEDVSDKVSYWGVIALCTYMAVDGYIVKRSTPFGNYG